MFFDRPTLKKELAKLIGFYQTNNSTYPTLSPSLIKSDISRYVNNVHGLIHVENIDQSIVNYSRYNYDTYDVATQYSLGDVVQLNTDVYEYINATATTGNLTSDTTYWLQLDALNQYLHQKRLQAVDRLLDEIFNNKKIKNTVKSIYDNVTLFSGAANYRDTETNVDKVVGLRIRMKHDRSLVTTIKKVIHQFSESVTVPLYLYHSSQQTPIATFSLVHTNANSSQQTVLTTNNELRYISDDYDAGGDFFLCYAQSDLATAKALNKYNVNWNGYSCRDCVGKTYDNYNQYSRYISVVGFSIDESEFTLGTDLFDPSLITLHYEKNFGLNLEMSNNCDLTPFVLQEKNLLGDALNNACGLEILRDMASNTRGGNQTANKVRDEARAETVTYKDTWGTVLDRTEKSFKALSFDLSQLDDDCLTCNDMTVDIGDSSFKISYERT